MELRVVLASGSPIRSEMLHKAGVEHLVDPARIDEDAITSSLLAEGTPVRDIADALVEAKARRISSRHTDSLVIGADQTLEIGQDMLSKPETADELRAHLRQLSGATHKLHSAAVIFEDARPVWRHVSTVSLTMRALSTGFIESYAERNWPGLADSVGGYKIEEEGIRLLSAINGNYFAILGLPLIELLSYLNVRGVLTT